MNRVRQRFSLVLGTGIVIGLVLGLVVSVTFGPPVAPGPESAQRGAAGASAEPRSHPDPNGAMVDGEQAERLMVAPVRLREFRDERTAVGRIAFNDERTTFIFAPFQGRVLRLIAKPGEVVYPGSPLVIIDSPDLVQANADLISASVAVKKAQNQVSLAERVARRQKLLYEAGAGAFKDLEQTASDFLNARNDLKTAEGQLTAARNRLRAPFGKSDAEIGKI